MAKLTDKDIKFAEQFLGSMVSNRSNELCVFEKSSRVFNNDTHGVFSYILAHLHIYFGIDRTNPVLYDLWRHLLREADLPDYTLR